MRNIYIYLVVIALLIAGLLALSFLYIDRQGHQSFLYAIYRDNELVGYEKMDRYVVENKLIYKSSLELPRDMLGAKTTRKITFDTGGKKFIDYTEEISANGAKNTIYLKNNNNAVSFLGISDAAFAYLEKINVVGNFTMFEDGAIVTYPTLVRRYNFKKRGEQFFNTLTPVSPNLPPLAGIVSITAIGKDVIDVAGKKVRCENLVFELSSGDLASVWVAQTFHNILMVKIPGTSFKAVLCTTKDVVPVEEYTKRSDLYSEKEVMFKNEDITLGGVLSIPNNGETSHPAVMLIWNGGPLDRTAMGMFTDIAHSLAKNGYCAFRFDKRGVGKSQGFFSTYNQSEEVDDLRKALEFLKSAPEVDPARIAVMGYGEGGLYAAYLSGMEEEGIRCCLIMSASSVTDPTKDDFKKIKEFIKKNITDDPQYLENAINTISQDMEMLRDKGDWIKILDNNVFTKKMRMQNNYDMIEALKKIKVPILILHGQKDSINFPEEAKELEETLSTGSNNNFTAIYFADLDHFMGKVVKNGKIRDHVEIDPSVTKGIISWLNNNLLPPEEEEEGKKAEATEIAVPAPVPAENP